MDAAILAYGKFITNAERIFLSFRRTVKRNLMFPFAQYDVVVQIEGQVRAVLANLYILFSVRIIGAGEIYDAARRNIYSTDTISWYFPAVIIRVFDILHGSLQLFFRRRTACTIRAFRSIRIPFRICQACNRARMLSIRRTIFIQIYFYIASSNTGAINHCLICAEGILTYNNCSAIDIRRWNRHPFSVFTFF